VQEFATEKENRDGAGIDDHVIWVVVEKCLGALVVKHTQALVA